MNYTIEYFHSRVKAEIESWPDGIGRAFYCFVVGQRVVILHAFVKKTQETPERELRIARRRMKEVQNG
jgi:phage-related protein